MTDPASPAAPRCLLCGGPTTLLYPSNIPSGEAIRHEEVACTSPHLAVYDDIFECRGCRLARSAPPAGKEEIEDLYRQVEDPAYFASEEERRASFRRDLEELERLNKGPGRVLEVGCAVGLFLDEAQRRGWKAMGIEPGEWASAQGRSVGLQVHTGTLEDFDHDGRPFDLVASWDVLEHLHDPVGDLHRMHALLKPGGLLAITTVNYASLGRKLFRRRWPWFMRMHLHYFTRESLATMVEKQGFTLESVTTQPKVLKLGYVLERAEGLFGVLARMCGAVARWTSLADVAVKIDLGDILFLIARR